MGSRCVLVVGGAVEGVLAEYLLQAGVEAEAAEDMGQVLERIGHEKYAAVLMEGGWQNCDVLELVLNIRDIDAEVPIVILGPLDRRRVASPFSSLGCICIGYRADDMGSLSGLGEVLENRRQNGN